MAKLPRYTQQIFGSSALTDQVAKFGSFAAGSPATYDGASVTPALVQALSNYLTGWFGAVVGNNSPMIEDMNSICYLFAYQLAYVFQSGVAEYDASTPYYTGSLCQSGGIVYRSLTDTNTGNALTSATYWAPMLFQGVLTQNNSVGSVTVLSGQVLSHPYLNVQNGNTYTIASGAYFRGTGRLTINGTMIVSGTSIINT